MGTTSTTINDPISTPISTTIDSAPGGGPRSGTEPGTSGTSAASSESANVTGPGWSGIGGAGAEFDHLSLQAGTIARTGASVEQAINAALEANQMPAPSDPMEQQLASMASRLATAETVLNALANNPAIGGGPVMAARLTNAENTLAALVKAAEEAEPLYARLKHLFDVHWAGKIPGP